MSSLLRMAEKLTNEESVYLRLFPVSGIAALEVFFRTTVAEMLDQSAVYLQRLNEAGLLRETKLDWTLLQAVVGKRVTVGEIVAHVLPLSQLGHLDRVLSALLDKPFRTVIGTVTVRAPWLEGDPVPAPIVMNPDADCGSVAQCFALRHQIAHEDYSPADLNQQAVITLLQALDRFTQAVSELAEQELYPNAPLTQAEMNQHAGAGAATADAALDEVWASMRTAFGTDGAEALDTLWSTFASFRAQRVDLAARAIDGGSMTPMIANWEYAAATREFTDAVKGLKRLYEPDWGTGPAEA